MDRIKSVERLGMVGKEIRCLLSDRSSLLDKLPVFGMNMPAVDPHEEG
jgi:hypothetical protein